MSDDDKKILNLDDLFGQAKPIKVRWQGQEYEFLRMDGITPKQALEFQRLQLKAGKIQNAESIDEASAMQIEEVFNDMLKILCPKIPLEEMTFLMKTRIVTFYIEETQGKNALETALMKATGATPSAV